LDKPLPSSALGLERRGVLDAQQDPQLVRARLSLAGAEVEVCDFPALRAEDAVTCEVQPILSLGLSPLLPDSYGRYRPGPRSRFASFGPLHLRPPSVPLQFRYAGGPFRSVRCRFDPDRFIAASGLAHWSEPVLEACLDIRAPRIEDSLLRLVDECLFPRPDSLALAAALTDLILVDLGRYFQEVQARADARAGGLPPALVRRVAEHVDQAAVPPGVEELAEICGLSRSHFIRSFRQSTGSTPAKYVEAARISRAKSMLVAGQEPIGRIAETLAYGSAAAFCKAFRRVTGRSPTDYRAHMR
jgi:AraC family transcriptional regulator